MRQKRDTDMQKWHPKHLKKRAVRAYHRVGGSDVVKRRDAAMRFAEKHELVYFHTVGADADTAPVIRGSTAAPHQVDSNFCIGSHAGYDMVAIERAADVAFGAFEPTFHKWYVLEIDLKHAKTVPYMFIGTKQQTKAYYAKVLTSHRNVAHLPLRSFGADATFHGNHVIIASPSAVHVVQRLMTADVMQAMAEKYPAFCVEMEDDRLIVSTEAKKPSEQLLDKLLHFGLWFAKEVDERLD